MLSTERDRRKLLLTIIVRCLDDTGGNDAKVE